MCCKLLVVNSFGRCRIARFLHRHHGFHRDVLNLSVCERNYERYLVSLNVDDDKRDRLADGECSAVHSRLVCGRLGLRDLCGRYLFWRGRLELHELRGGHLRLCGRLKLYGMPLRHLLRDGRGGLHDGAVRGRVRRGLVCGQRRLCPGGGLLRQQPGRVHAVCRGHLLRAVFRELRLGCHHILLDHS